MGFSDHIYTGPSGAARLRGGVTASFLFKVARLRGRKAGVKAAACVRMIESPRSGMQAAKVRPAFSKAHK